MGIKKELPHENFFLCDSPLMIGECVLKAQGDSELILKRIFIIVTTLKKGQENYKKSVKSVSL